MVELIVSPGSTGTAEPHIGVAEVGDGVERDVGHGLAEHRVEDEQVVHRLPLEAERAGELGVAVQRVAGPPVSAM